MTCSNCGHSGPDVIERQAYVGGAGYGPIAECTNSTECWQRRDAQDALGWNWQQNGALDRTQSAVG